MIKSIKPFIATFVLIAYLALGSFLMMGMMDHHHMMAGGCPFMPGEQAMCQMDAFDHISAWQSAFVSVVPTILILSILAAVVVFAWRHWYPPPDLILASVAYRARARTTIVPLYQQLFSRGILNPKIP